MAPLFTVSVCLWFAECGANITSGHGGVIMSPNYPDKYAVNASCEWYIYPTKPSNRILLEFADFKMEGTSHSEYDCFPSFCEKICDCKQRFASSMLELNKNKITS